MSKRKDPNEGRRGILISLDDLFDSRLGVLNKHWPEVANKVLTNGYYHERLSDAFEGVSHEAFAEAYKNRDASCLAGTYITPVLYFVREAIAGFLLEVIQEPFRNVPKLFINTYPYISDPEWEEGLLEYLYPRLADRGSLAIEFIRKSPSDLTTTWVSTFVNLFFCYEAWVWIDAQTQNGEFAKRTCAETKLFVPRIDTTGQQTPQSIMDLTEKEGVDPFTFVKKQITPMLDLEWIPVRYFSIVDPVDIEKRMSRIKEPEIIEVKRDK